MTKTLPALLVEDSESDAKLVARELRRAYDELHVARVADAPCMRAALASSPWDVIACDWTMPKFGALAALALVKELGFDIPFIIVSGTERAERRRTDEERRQLERKCRRLDESGLIGIVIADVTGGIRDANDTFLKMIGYSREELRQGAVRWADLAPPEVTSVSERATASIFCAWPSCSSVRRSVSSSRARSASQSPQTCCCARCEGSWTTTPRRHSRRRLGL